MANNIYSGAVPINLRKDPDLVSKAVAHDHTSYRDGIVHKTEVRSQYDDPSIMPRNTGCTPLRRFPNGQLDIQFVAQTIISLFHKAHDGGLLTEFEKSILTLILPDKFNLIDKRIAGTMAKISDQEKAMVALLVNAHLKEELNWQAGHGGGTVEGRSVTRS